MLWRKKRLPNKQNHPFKMSMPLTTTATSKSWWRILVFNSFIISKQDEKKLLKSDDLFDLAILACLYIIRTREDMEKRLIYKKKLHNLAMEKNFSTLQMEKILIFVEEMLQLPAPIELKFEKHLNFKYKKLRAMELSQNSKNMFDAMFSGMFKGKFGMSYQKMMKQNEQLRIKSEAEQRKAEAAPLQDRTRELAQSTVYAGKGDFVQNGVG